MDVFKVSESGEECEVQLEDGQKLKLFIDGEGLHIDAEHRLASTVSCYAARMLVFVNEPT